MQTTDWNFDFSKLPYWENHNLSCDIYDEFLDIPQSNTLCCIYSIAEVSMCNYQGFLAIIKNREKPSLFLNITEGFNFCDNISANTEGNLIFLQPSLYNKETGVVKRPILIIDVEKNMFSYYNTDNINPCYKIVQLNKNVFKIDADAYQSKNDRRLKALSKRRLRINRLKWRNLNEIASLPKLIL